jgi:hypothetical protein
VAVKGSNDTRTRARRLKELEKEKVFKGVDGNEGVNSVGSECRASSTIMKNEGDLIVWHSKKDGH